MQLKLNLDSLGELDGGAARAVVDAALRTAVTDLDDRGEDGKPREVNIKIVMLKHEGTTFIHLEAAPKLPNFRVRATVGLLNNDGRPGGAGILFQSMAPDDPRQRTIDELAAGEIPPQ